MSVSLGDVLLYLKADDRSLNKQLGATEKRTRGWATGLGGTLKNAFSFALGGLIESGIRGIANELGSVVSEAMEAEETQAALAAVLKSTGGVAGVTAEMANDLATSLSQVTRYSDDAVLSGENLLLTFTGIGKDIFPEATAVMLDMSTALGQDLKSSALQLGKALNDPIAGVSALQRVGVSFTEAQKDQIKAMVEAGDVMGAQKLILAELSREFGGAAEAAGATYAGKLDILKNKFGEIKETIGGLLIPVLAEGATWLSDRVGGALTWLSETGVPTFQDKAQEAWNWIANTAIPKTQEWATTIRDWIEPRFIALRDDILPPLLTKAQEVWAGIQAAVTDAWAGFKPHMEAMAAKWVEFKDDLLPRVVELFGNVKTNVDALIQPFQTLTNPTLSDNETGWIKVGDAVGKLLDYRVTATIDTWSKSMDLLNGLLKLAAPLLGKVSELAAWLTDNVIIPLGEKLGLDDSSGVNHSVSILIGLLRDMLTLNPMIAIMRFTFDRFTEALEGVGQILEWLKEKVDDFKDALSSIEAPDWLIPGSPTPFEMGLRGIARAIDDMPDLNATFGLRGLAGATAGGATYNLGGIHFAGGSGAPATADQASDAAFLMVNALRARGMAL